jgi:hypothetical protein
VRLVIPVILAQATTQHSGGTVDFDGVQVPSDPKYALIMALVVIVVLFVAIISVFRASQREKRVSGKGSACH